MNIDTTKKPFLIESENLEKLRPEFIKACDMIKKAIDNKRHIIIKHHDDTDGYISGIVLEKAILPLIPDYKKHYFFTRSVSKAPYFEYIDALRILNNYSYGNDRIPPLIILTDLGSNNQSMKSINRLLDYGFEIIIVDHHKFDQMNKEVSCAFINPHAYGYDSNICAGALATELALFINPALSEITHLPALSGTADKSSGEEHKRYVELSNFSPEELDRWSVVVDHETYYLRFQATTELFDNLLFPKERTKMIIDSIYRDIIEDFKDVEKAARKYVKVTEIGGISVLEIDKNKIGNYEYASSKLTRITQDLSTGPRITLAVTDSMVSYRSDQTGFDGVKLIETMKERFPYAMVSGGGHSVAGSIIFNALSKEEIIEFIYDYIKKL